MTKLENQGDSEAMDCSEEAGTYGLRGHIWFIRHPVKHWELSNVGSYTCGLEWPRMASEAVQIHWKTLQFGGIAKLLF